MTRFAPLFALLLAACSPKPTPPAIEFRDVWARAVAQGQTSGAVYMTILNTGGEADRLLSAKASVAPVTMLHRSATTNGIVSMTMLPSLDIPAKGEAVLAPGGTHLMMSGLTVPLSPGDRFFVDLTFEKSGHQTTSGKIVAAGRAMSLARTRLLLWALVGLAAAGALVAALWPADQTPAVQQQAMAPVGGPFTLTGTDGKPFASNRLNGKPAAIFFGFTHCPDVCPTTLARLIKLRRKVGSDFAIVFISVDPERDTPAELARFTSLFDGQVIALTGSQSEIERVKKLYGIYSEKVPQPDGDYSINHSAAVFLMDRDGKFTATLAPDEKDSVAQEKLKKLTT